MNQRTGRGHVKKHQVMEKLGVGRVGAIQVRQEAKIKSDEYRAAQGVLDAIDELSETLTGDREYFWLKSAPSSHKVDE